jgi:hypothetical protein
MKRFAAVLFLLGVGSMLPGCPIYGDDSGCSVDEDCPVDYVCDSLVGSCRPNTCTAPTQCPTSQTCSRAGTCVASDCSWPEVGCVAGYVCSTETGIWECVKPTGAGAEGGAPGSGGAGGGSSTAGATGGTDASGGADTSGGTGTEDTGGTGGTAISGGADAGGATASSGASG